MCLIGVRKQKFHISTPIIPKTAIFELVKVALYNKLCGRPPQYAPAPLTFDLQSGVRVTCDMGYLLANFSLPRPLCSRLRPDVRDRQKADIQTSHAHHRLMPPTPGAGHSSRRKQAQKELQMKQTECLVPRTCLPQGDLPTRAPQGGASEVFYQGRLLNVLGNLSSALGRQCSLQHCRKNCFHNEGRQPNID